MFKCLQFSTNTNYKHVKIKLYFFVDPCECNIGHFGSLIKMIKREKVKWKVAQRPAKNSSLNCQTKYFKKAVAITMHLNLVLKI